MVKQLGAQQAEFAVSLSRRLRERALSCVSLPVKLSYNSAQQCTVSGTCKVNNSACHEQHVPRLPALATHQPAALACVNHDTCLALPEALSAASMLQLDIFFHLILLPAGPAAVSVAVGTDDLVDPSGAGEAYYYDPDEEVEPEPKALRWARENPWCAGS